ncbi:MAG TPA: hypothetical protein VGI39_07115 [Polyangiaceae bacterium]|jgi:hypothetical protein
MKMKKLVACAFTVAMACSACAVDATAPAGATGEASASTSEALNITNVPFVVSQWWGGPGGDLPPIQEWCPYGYVVAGFYGNSGTTMDSIGLHCAAFNGATWQHTANIDPVGGSGGNFYSSWCPPNTYVTQVAYDYESTVSQLSMRCSNGPWIRVAGSPSEYIVGDDCYAAGAAMKGLDIVKHTYVDRVRTECVGITR